jgi:hypothetical protein
LPVDQSKVLFGVKKEGNQRDFFVVKGILWTKGLRIVLLVRAYALVSEIKTQPIQSKKGRGNSHLLAGIRMDSSIGRCTVALNSINMAASAPTCLRCMDSACGKAAKVLPPWPHHAPPSPVEAITCIGLQVEVVVDYEISLWLPPCVASRITRIAKQRRLQGWWQQRRRWIRLVTWLVKTCSHGHASRHKCKVYAMPAAADA